MTTYRTSDGDTLDWICWKHYGREGGAIEAVLDANPGLADLGAVFAAGVSIELPVLAPAATTAIIRLWD